MNWKNLFKASEILTQADRDELEALDKKAEPFVVVREKIEKDFVTSINRIGTLQALAEEYANNIQNDSIYQRMLMVAGMPSTLGSGHQHRDCVVNVFDRKIEEIHNEGIPAVRRVLSRALSRAEVELKKIEQKEQDEARAGDYPYLPSGKIQALQQRVLGLRNALNEKYKNEGSVQSPPHWKERLREWL